MNSKLAVASGLLGLFAVLSPSQASAQVATDGDGRISIRTDARGAPRILNGELYITFRAENRSSAHALSCSFRVETGVGAIREVMIDGISARGSVDRVDHSIRVASRADISDVGNIRILDLECEPEQSGNDLISFLRSQAIPSGEQRECFAPEADRAAYLIDRAYYRTACPAVSTFAVGRNRPIEEVYAEIDAALGLKVTAGDAN